MTTALMMPKRNAPNKQETTGIHRPASLEHIAARLDEIATHLRTAATLMQTDPALAEVEVRYERSLRDGLKFLTNWTDELRDTVSNAKLDLLRSE